MLTYVRFYVLKPATLMMTDFWNLRDYTALYSRILVLMLTDTFTEVRDKVD